MPPFYRLRTDGVPVNRPSAFGPGHTSNGASWASIPLKTAVEATGGTMTTYGHPSSITIVGDPQMANYLPAEQIPSRWAPPIAGNQLRVVITTPCAFMTHTPNNQPEHIPVPIMQTQWNTTKTAQQLDQRRQAFKGGPKNLATPSPGVRPVFRLYGGGST